jgi:uncharacterized protein DUF6893
MGGWGWLLAGFGTLAALLVVTQAHDIVRYIRIRNM